MNKITKQNGTLLVPDKVVIPFIEGDGVGAEITPVCQRIVDEAVGRAYGGQRVIEWKEVLAGEKAFKADPRPLCLPPSGTLVPWSCDTCQRAGKS